MVNCVFCFVFSSGGTLAQIDESSKWGNKWEQLNTLLEKQMTKDAADSVPHEQHLRVK